MVELSLENQLAELEVNYNELVELFNKTPRIVYAEAGKELSGFSAKLKVKDPALEGVSCIAEKAAELSMVRDRVGEMTSQAIKRNSLWKDLSAKVEELYEKVKGAILIGDAKVEELRNQALQLAWVNKQDLPKKVLSLQSKIKTECSLANSHLAGCEQSIAKIEFADKCLDKQIKSVNIQLYLNEVPKRIVPLAKYVKVTNTGSNVNVNVSGEEKEE